MSHWLHLNEIYDPEYDQIEHAGFVYLITNEITNVKYIGSKRLHKKRTLPALKGKKRKRIVRGESDWRTYLSSCDELVADIEKHGKENFTFEIVSFHANYTELNYAELCLQIILNVLDARSENGERVFYNRNIARRFYPSKVRWEERTAMLESFKNTNHFKK